MDADSTTKTEVLNASGLCLFGNFAMPPDATARFLAAATGWDIKEEDLFQMGKRIINMRYAFNLREGQNPAENVLPRRCVGEPPQKEGPLKDITVDCDKLAEQFFENMGWDNRSMIPTKESLEELGGMEDVIKDLYG